MSDKEWQVIQISDVQDQLQGNPAEYLEFLRVPSLSCGLYRLCAGSKDLQGSHDEDEVYFVVAGKGQLRVNDDVQQVRPGSVLYIRAEAKHSFFEIEEDMTLLVVFAANLSRPV